MNKFLHTLAALALGTMALTAAPATPSPTISHAESTATFTVYFENTSSWTTPCVYAWTDPTSSSGSATKFAGDWPGTEMTLVEGTTNIYTWSTSEGVPEKVIFNGLVGTTRKQTKNLTATTGHLYKGDKVGTDTYNNDIYGSDSGQYIIVAEEASADSKGGNIYYYNSESWTQVYCYVYKSTVAGLVVNKAWPGVAMRYDESIEMSGKTGFWVYDVPAELAESNVIFTNNDGSQFPASGQKGIDYNSADGIMVCTGNSVDEIYTGVESVASEVAAQPVSYYTLQGIKVVNPVKGQLYIVAYSDSTVRKVVY